MPSYLSLACTVNGYSITTNYDPERLAKSRDTSPHRPTEHVHDTLATYAVQNNLLSPPNLVPLPMQKINKQSPTMSQHTVTSHHFIEKHFSTSTTTSYVSSKQTKCFTSSNGNSKDTIDACFERKYMNGKQEVTSKTNGSECKSFIQQRVERLYGPGALAQGFFVSKRRQNMSFDPSNNVETNKIEVHSKSMSDELLDNSTSECNMKQSCSSPSLPVLRHLTPEFRAQLPMLSPRRGVDSSMPKSSTVPVLSVNGHTPSNGNTYGCHTKEKEDIAIGVKDGHHFIKVLDEEAKGLLELADKAELDLNIETLPEDAKGVLRSTTGKARLLVSQKMQQFKGLCTNNITQVEGVAFPTTNEDLQGFWDMVMLQVDQVDNLFKELETLKANNWIEKKKIVDNVDRVGNNVKSRKAPVVRVQSAAAEEARKKREQQRKQMLEDRRKAMRDQKANSKSIEIFVPNSS